ncbi:type IV pilin N-terminal domain-containing protein, partial [Methanosarcina sp. 1.H.A.2.2]|uniref:type IV pilin N-terminal domain-containing protein n=1 Tax=Methanosarcina sp. 1.H.A.2.2 TaxID=1483601 RepID=UPI00064FB4DD
MEGKKYRALGQDCQAVSEVIGQVLMVAVVVLAFSSIALTVFSDGGAMNPPHTPKTDLQESIDIDTNTVQIFHIGGEAIDLKYIKIILNVDGQQAEFNMSDSNVTVFDPKGNKLNSDDVFVLGDYIVIDPSSKINITGVNATIDLYFVHTESRQVIKKAIL